MKRNQERFRPRKISFAVRIVVMMAVLGLGLVGTPAFACTFDVQVNESAKGNAKLEWEPVAGALYYDIYEQTGYSSLMYAGTARRGVIEIPPATTDQQQHSYTVFARSNDPNFLCVGGNRLIIGDRELGTLTEKKIIPLVGSVRGANGSDFRTSLTLTKTALRKGRIVFRPTGTVASSADPFIRYAFGDNNDGSPEEFHWDDIVSAIGATGTGSLEIIPEKTGGETSLRTPPISARVYNVAEKGTFGAHADAVRPAEWFLSPATQHASVGIFVPAAHGNSRRNIGFRTLTSVMYRITVFTPGQPSYQVTGNAPAAFTQFSSLDAFVGQHVPDNAYIYVSFMDGFAIGFYTETDNVTNDPILVVDTPSELEDSVSWGFQGGLPESRTVQQH